MQSVQNEQNKLINLKELWTVAKNNISVKDPIVKLWSTSEIYKCRYDDPINKIIDNLDKNTYIKPL
jgi:hypothetical protein